MNIKKNFAFNSLLLLSQYLIPMIIFPYTSRVFGVDKIGIINWADSIVNYFIMFSTLGLTLIGIREIAAQKNNPKELNKVFSELLVVHIILTVIVCILYILLIQEYPKFNEYKTLLYIGLSKLIFNIFLVEWFYRGIENFKFITIRSIFIKVIYVFAVFIFVREPNDYVAYFILTCGITVINAIVNCWYARDKIKIVLTGLKLIKHLAPLATIGLYMLLTSMYTTFNTMYLGISANNHSVGSYTTALKLYTIILGVFTALNTVLVPRLSSLVSENNLDQFNKIVQSSMTFVVTLCFPIITCGMVLAPQIIQVLSGSGYEDAIPCFRIILPLILIVGIAQILSNQVLMTLKKDKVLAYTSVLGAAIGLTLNIILVPKYKEIGTSYIILISELSVTIALYYLCYKYAKTELPIKNIILNLLASIPYILICFFTNRLIENNIYILSTSGIMSLVYFVFSQMLLIKNQLVVIEFQKIISKILNIAGLHSPFITHQK